MSLETKFYRNIINESFEKTQAHFPNVTKKQVRKILRPLFRGATVREYFPIVGPRRVLEELERRDSQIHSSDIVLQPDTPLVLTKI